MVEKKKEKKVKTAKKEAKKEADTNESQSAEDITKAMVENIKANMADPNFEADRERVNSEAAEKALKKHGLLKDKPKPSK